MRLRSLRLVSFIALGTISLVAVASCSRGSDTKEKATARTPVAVSGASEPDDGQWLMASKDYANNRFSGLAKSMLATFGTCGWPGRFRRHVRGHEAAPLVVGDTMYFVTPYPNILYALDLKNHGAEEVEVQAEAVPRPLRASPAATWSIAAPRTGNGKIIYNTLDAHTSPSTPRPAKELWKTQARRHQPRRDDHDGADRRQGQSARRQQRRRDRRSRLDRRARRRRTASIAWRAYSTGPDADVLIGPRFKPFYAQRSRQGPRRHDVAARRTGRSAAAPCGAGSRYDPELESRSTTARAIPGPWNPDSARATTSGPPASSRATRTPAKPYGRTSGVRTTCRTTTASTRTCCSICRSTGRPERCSCTPTATAISTCSTAQTGEVLSADSVRAHHHHARGRS